MCLHYISYNIDHTVSLISIIVSGWYINSHSFLSVMAEIRTRKYNYSDIYLNSKIYVLMGFLKLHIAKPNTYCFIYIKLANMQYEV